MKVLILGGAGTMAMGGASYLARYDDISEIMMTDINLEAVQSVADRLQSPKIKTKYLDALNKDMLIEEARKYDVVLSCVGPYTKYGVPILESIIEAGVNYVDVCDDHDAAIELMKLNDKAIEKGVSALICMGTTPGISNVQAKAVYDMLDECDSMKIAWAITTPDKEMAKGTHLEKSSGLISEAAWDHLIHVATGKVPIWKDGKWDEIDAIEHGEWVDFDKPLGRAESYYIGHAEPVTLAKYLDIKDFCGCLGSIMPPVMKRLRKEARGHEEALYPPKPINKEPFVGNEIWQDRGVWGGQAVIVEGTKDNRKVRITSRLQMGIHDINGYNSSGQAIGTYMMGKGLFDKKGVYAPEVVIDPDEFFKELAQYYSDDSGKEFTVDDVNMIEIEYLD